MVSQFESMGTEKADLQNKSHQAEYERVKQEQLIYREDLKSAGGEKRALEDRRRKFVKYRTKINYEMKLETPGKPRFPVEPGFAPRQPSGRYTTNRCTKEEKYEPPTDREIKEYQNKLRVWRQSVANYQRDRQEYPEKMMLWNLNDAERRANLQAQFNATQAGINDTEIDIAKGLANVRQGVGKDLKETRDQLKQLERSAAISSIAFKHFSSTEHKKKNLIRPSNFHLIDYESECSRLRKSLGSSGVSGTS